MNQVEGGHRCLKDCLRTFRGDLDQIIDAIEAKIMNQEQNYNNMMVTAKHQRPFYVFNPLYCEVITYISHPALDKICEQKGYLDRPS